jgi:hypothetical protein
MSDKSTDPKIYPPNIVGFLIMVADLIALGYWSFAIWKPRAMALIAAGKWTWWDGAWKSSSKRWKISSRSTNRRPDPKVRGGPAT